MDQVEREFNCKLLFSPTSSSALSGSLLKITLEMLIGKGKNFSPELYSLLGWFNDHVVYGTQSASFHPTVLNVMVWNPRGWFLLSGKWVLENKQTQCTSGA